MFTKPIVRDVLLKNDLITAVVFCIASLFGEAYVLHYSELGFRRILDYVIENRRVPCLQEDSYL
jgi:hypothetical protein